jgi:hypothetical protein
MGQLTVQCLESATDPLGYCRTSICCFFLICNLQADSMFENILFFFQSSRRAFALPELLLLFDNVLGEDLWTEI